MTKSPWWQAATVADTLAQLPKTLPTHFGCIYALEWGNHIKIGYSTNPRTRLKALAGQARNYSGLLVGQVMVTPPHTNFLDNETALHRALSDVRGGGELFAASLSEFHAAAKVLDLRDDSAAREARADAATGLLKRIVTGGAPTNPSIQQQEPPDAFSFFLQVAKGQV